MCQTGIVCAGWNVLDPRLSPGSTVTNNPCTADAMGAWDAPVFDPYTQTMYDSGYFWFHHSDADTMERIDPTQLNTNAASLAIWAYSIAQLPELLPRNDPAPPDNNNDDSKDKKTPDTTLIIILSVVGGVLVLGFIGLFVYRVNNRKTRDVTAHEEEYSPLGVKDDP